MPMPEKSKSFFQKVLYVSTSIAIIGGAIGYIFSFKEDVKEWFKHQVNKSVEHHIEEFKGSYDRLKIMHINDSIRLDNHITERSSTFAVGMRVDRHTGLLWYRAENGEEYRAHKDYDLTHQYGFEVHYYIDEANGNIKRIIY